MPSRHIYQEIITSGEDRAVTRPSVAHCTGACIVVMGSADIRHQSINQTNNQSISHILCTKNSYCGWNFIQFDLLLGSKDLGLEGAVLCPFNERLI